MFNIQRELELAGAEGFSLGGTAYFNGDYIRAPIHRNGRFYDDWSFDPETGLYISHEGQDQKVWRLRPKSEMRPIARYFLHTGQRDWPKDGWVKCENQQFDEGGSAAERMKIHNERANENKSPYRFIVKKEVELSPIRDYGKWAEERVETGEWTLVPWAGEPWVANHPYHYTHLARQDDSMVAFWACEADAQQDLISIMTPGRYLQNYFSDHLTNEEIRDWAVKVDVEAELKFADTPEGIYEVYSNGPDSCMAYKDAPDWRSNGQNPTRVYGAGDLAVAYLVRKTKIIARALCWPAKKAVGRIYGDIERMEEKLRAEGWSFDAENHNASSRGEGLFEGARILKIKVEAYPNNFVMPYLDFGYKLKITDSDDEFFYLTRQSGAGHTCNRTDGLLFELGCEPDDEDDQQCDRCNDWFHEDDLNSVGDGVWCDSCTEYYAANCVVCERTYAEDNMTRVEGGDYYCARHDDGISSCDYCSERHHTDDLTDVMDARSDTAEDPETFTEACNHCLHHEDSIQHDVNGVWIDTDTAQQCESCESWFSNNLEEDECPNPTCVEARAATELETAE